MNKLLLIIIIHSLFEEVVKGYLISQLSLVKSAVSRIFNARELPSFRK